MRNREFHVAASADAAVEVNEEQEADGWSSWNSPSYRAAVEQFEKEEQEKKKKEAEALAKAEAKKTPAQKLQEKKAAEEAAAKQKKEAEEAAARKKKYDADIAEGIARENAAREQREKEQREARAKMAAAIAKVNQEKAEKDAKDEKSDKEKGCVCASMWAQQKQAQNAPMTHASSLSGFSIG